MSGFTIDIKENLSNLDNLTAEVKAIVQDELNAFGLEVVDLAKNLAPVDIGFLRNGITFDQLPAPDIGINIVSAYFYSAYLEFGTGIFAAEYVTTLPLDIQEYAMTFYVNGQGRIRPHPFLFPAIFTLEKPLVSRLKQQLNAG